MIPEHIQMQYDNRLRDALELYCLLSAEARQLLTLEEYTRRYLATLPPLMWTGGTAA